MPVTKPASFVAGRTITIGGTTYQPGAAVPNSVVKALPRLAAMLSNGMVQANIDIFGRHTKASNHEPSFINPTMRKSL